LAANPRAKRFGGVRLSACAGMAPPGPRQPAKASGSLPPAPTTRTPGDPEGPTAGVFS